MVNKSVQNAVLSYNLKNERMILVHFQGKPFNLTVIQIYVPITNAEEAEVDWFDASRPSRINTKKRDVLFITGDWNAKVGSQEISGVTGKFDLEIQKEAGQRLTDLPREHTGHSKHPPPATKETTLHMDITRWPILKSD